jgi:hypothetical protein
LLPLSCKITIKKVGYAGDNKKNCSRKMCSKIANIKASDNKRYRKNPRKCQNIRDHEKTLSKMRIVIVSIYGTRKKSIVFYE